MYIGTYTYVRIAVVDVVGGVVGIVVVVDVVDVACSSYDCHRDFYV